MICPICNGELIRDENNGFMIVLDGNSTYTCKENEFHRFWIHPFSHNIIHFNPESSPTNFKSFYSWEIKDDDSYIMQLNSENITNLISYIKENKEFINMMRQEIKKLKNNQKGV